LLSIYIQAEKIIEKNKNKNPTNWMKNSGLGH
jgi:hypothetical protein